MPQRCPISQKNPCPLSLMRPRRSCFPKGKTPSYMADHRKRLRTRFVEGGAEAMSDYELLELILFRAVPRQDVKPMNHGLMNAFGDLNRVITADYASSKALEKL